MEQTDRSQTGEGWEDRKSLAKEHICIDHGYRQQCGELRAGVVNRGWVAGGKAGEM